MAMTLEESGERIRTLEDAFARAYGPYGLQDQLGLYRAAFEQLFAILGLNPGDALVPAVKKLQTEARAKVGRDPDAGVDREVIRAQEADLSMAKAVNMNTAKALRVPVGVGVVATAERRMRELDEAVALLRQARNMIGESPSLGREIGEFIVRHAK